LKKYTEAWRLTCTLPCGAFSWPAKLLLGLDGSSFKTPFERVRRFLIPCQLARPHPKKPVLNLSAAISAGLGQIWYGSY
jgi:hypothetical protein